MATKKTAAAGTTVKPASATSVAKKAATTRTAKKAAPTKAAPTKAVAKKSATTAAAATKTATQKAVTQKAVAKKTVTKKSATKAPAATKAAAPKAAAPKAATTKAATTETAAKTPARGTGGSRQLTDRLRVKDDESPWSSTEIDEMRAVLVDEIETHHEEVRLAEAELDVLLRDAGDGAGADEADAGTMTAERVHEIALANNAHASLEQAQHALEQLDAGTYGICENCGQPIGKLRLQARPRATLCMPCQAKQDRH